MVVFNQLNPFANPASSASEITQLRIYPIKSCRGIKVTHSYLTRQGLELDRRWMFVDASDNKFITIRDISDLTLIETALTESSDHPHTGRAEDQFLTISIRNTSKSISIPARPTQSWLEANTTLQSKVTIWSTDTDGYVYNDEFNSIFSDFLGRKVALVYKGPTARLLGAMGAPEVLGRKESTNFPDVMPLQIANEASIRELNARLTEKGMKPITIEHFRPNIVVRGVDADNSNDKLAPKAWTEDRWKLVRILNETAGSSWLSAKSMDVDVQARCARCLVPNVNPDTAEKDEHEPWDTMVSYRRVDEGIKFKPCFGMLGAPRNEGRIAVGMKFQVLETTDSHKYIKGF